MKTVLIQENLTQKIKSKSPQKYQDIIDYYEIAGEDYAEWSKYFNMHFGYFKWGMNPFNLEPMLDQMTAQVHKALQIPKHQNAKILDLGCGLGTSARYMAKLSKNYQLKGLTIVPWQVRIARKINFREKTDQQIDIVLGDYTKMPFEAQSQDFAYALESSCHGEGKGKEALIQEVSRVLKKGGRFVVADFFLKHQRPLPKIIQKIADKTCNYWALPEFGEINTFEATLHQHGFKNIKIREISWNVAPSVAHIPKTVSKFLWKEWINNKSLKMKKERWNNALAPLLGMLLGLCRNHFGYYIIQAVRK